MGDLSNTPNFQTAPTQYTHADLNAVFQALTIAVGAVTTNKLADKAVTFAKVQDITPDYLLGRASAGAGSPELIACAAAGRTLLAAADAAAQRAALRLVIGTDVQAFDADLTAIAALTTTEFGRDFLALAGLAAGRTKLGLVPGTDVQAFDATLAALAAVVTAANKLIYATAADTFATTTLTAAARNLLDDEDPDEMRGTLGLGDCSPLDVGTEELTVCAGNDPRLADSRPCDNTFDDAEAARGNLSIGSMALRNVTISTDDPSGGENGDIWIKIAS